MAVTTQPEDARSATNAKFKSSTIIRLPSPLDSLQHGGSSNQATTAAEKPSLFLSLPPEIRNKIYELAIDSNIVVEMMPANAPYRCTYPWVDRSVRAIRSTRNGRRKKISNRTDDTRKRQTQWESAITALHLVNKQLYNETKLYLYSRAILYFQSTKKIRRFVRLAPRDGLGCISSLSLGIQTYAPPCTGVAAPWVQKSHDSWSRCIRMMSQQMSNVQRLQVAVDVLENPLVFNFGQAWVAPLLLCASFGKLEQVSVTVTSDPLREALEWADERNDIEDFIKRRNINEEECMYRGIIWYHRQWSIALGRRIMGYCESCSCEELYSTIMDTDLLVGKLFRTARWRSSPYAYMVDWSSFEK